MTRTTKVMVVCFACVTGLVLFILNETLYQPKRHTDLSTRWTVRKHEVQLKQMHSAFLTVLQSLEKDSNPINEASVIERIARTYPNDMFIFNDIGLTNSLVAISPEFAKWLAFDSKEIALYGTEIFRPNDVKHPVRVAICFDGNAILITNLPNWKPMDLKVNSARQP